ncbi:MAG: glycine cleavage system aminomethyltransferase GcvT [Kiritimatiellaeota bacterium]|nr:glycine cleavage system aminomethyltransferase GcvT [Kiritimatiellota bacterium]
MAKKTPLYGTHVRLGGDMAEYAGHILPVRYDGFGVIPEHKAVREKCGVFDVSHMGEFIVHGANAETALNKLLTNDIRGMSPGQIKYTLIPNDNGGAVDDALVHCFNREFFFIVVNAANLEKDEAWFRSRLDTDGVEFSNVSDTTAELALQGPCAKAIMLKLVSDENALPAKYYTFADKIKVGGVLCLISRSGYTGEAGYEIYCDAKDAATLFDIIMEAGKEYGLIPCGLGARDTLRLEAGMPLYGHELNEDINISEVGFDFAVKLGKDDFIGKNAIQNHTPQYTRIGARVSKGIAREHDKIFSGDECVGEVTSGTHAPWLGYAIAVLRVKKEHADKPLEAEVRGRRLPLQITPLPFYTNKDAKK